MKITNNSGGQLVCTLKDGTTLRLNNKKTCYVSNSKITPYITGLSNKGLVFLEETQTKTKKQVKEEIKEE